MAAPGVGAAARSNAARGLPGLWQDADFAPYCERNLVERFFNKLKHFRAIATRYDKLARNRYHSWGSLKLFKAPGPPAESALGPPHGHGR